MDWSSITPVLTAIIGGICVAVPSIYQTRKSIELTTFRLEQLEKQIETLNEKFDKHEEHGKQIAKLETRVDAAEVAIKELLQQH